MLELGHIELRSANVVLRPMKETDAEALAAAAAESREHYRFNPVPNGLASAEAYISRALAGKAAGARYPFSVEWCGRIVGTTSYSEFQPWEWPAGCNLQRHDRPDALEI